MTSSRASGAGKPAQSSSNRNASRQGIDLTVQHIGVTRRSWLRTGETAESSPLVSKKTHSPAGFMTPVIGRGPAGA